eukprot:3348634-Amphidinium_carterae.2
MSAVTSAGACVHSGMLCHSDLRCDELPRNFMLPLYEEEHVRQHVCSTWTSKLNTTQHKLSGTGKRSNPCMALQVPIRVQYAAISCPFVDLKRVVERECCCEWMC